MKKILAAVTCAVALVGCGGPIDENDPSGQQQDMLVQPEGLPLPMGEARLDGTQVQIPTRADVVANPAQFQDQYIWGVTERPHGCGGK